MADTGSADSMESRKTSSLQAKVLERLSAGSSSAALPPQLPPQQQPPHRISRERNEDDGKSYHVGSDRKGELAAAKARAAAKEAASLASSTPWAASSGRTQIWQEDSSSSGSGDESDSDGGHEYRVDFGNSNGGPTSKPSSAQQRRILQARRRAAGTGEVPTDFDDDEDDDVYEERRAEPKIMSFLAGGSKMCSKKDLGRCIRQRRSQLRLMLGVILAMHVIGFIVIATTSLSSDVPEVRLVEPGHQHEDIPQEAWLAAGWGLPPKMRNAAATTAAPSALEASSDKGEGSNRMADGGVGSAKVPSEGVAGG
eukprot:TRINITY_DN34293_c2_g1_i1.p1 TRINITY_DN34293_c2_g1~~TRINITY_DN34293_c2_g1_i1.p1  ORF type:complete len:311 (+),score=62.98 TRINITY_DN34293_c2_g1_i1:92-1024(+)